MFMNTSLLKYAIRGRLYVSWSSHVWCKIIANFCNSDYNACTYIYNNIIYSLQPWHVSYLLLSLKISTRLFFLLVLRGRGVVVVGLFVLWKWGGLESKLGVGTQLAAKTPINTLIAFWREQAVPTKDTLGHWGEGGGGESFPRADAWSDCGDRNQSSQELVRDRCLGVWRLQLGNAGG